MLPRCLYSVNPWIKWLIHSRYLGDVHFVWCSPVFDPRRLGAEDHGSLIAPSSSPAAIFKELSAAVNNRERHNERKLSLIARTEDWRAKGLISGRQADDVLFIINDNEISNWRPLLYIIPVAGIDHQRIERVPLADCAGYGDEYIIRDLAGSEFDRIQFDV